MEPSSFLSVANIPDFLAQQFSGCQLLHSFSPEHLFLKTTVQQLLQSPISNWKFNRPPDILRCRNIAQTIYRQRAPIEAVFYLAYDSGPRRTFDVLDGIHRITALRHLLEENAKPIDVFADQPLGCQGSAVEWVHPMTVFLNVRFNASTSELIAAFENINKSVPVPELFYRNPEQEKSEILTRIANHWQNMFAAHFSANAKPNRPNINRDQLILVLEQVYNRAQLTPETAEKNLQHLLTRLNQQLSFTPPPKITETVRKKCANSGCWVFCFAPDVLVNRLCAAHLMHSTEVHQC